VLFVVRTRRVSRVPVDPIYFEELAHPKTKFFKRVGTILNKRKMLLVVAVVEMKRNNLHIF
ncbi:MAG: hypothetical protein ACI8RD_006498, partial [Bacillariaceae sp.]|jgi:hypothetical protein